MSGDKTLTYSVDEAAALLGVSRASAYKAAGCGQIPALRIGKRLVVPRAAFDELLQPKSAEARAAGPG